MAGEPLFEVADHYVINATFSHSTDKISVWLVSGEREDQSRGLKTIY